MRKYIQSQKRTLGITELSLLFFCPLVLSIKKQNKKPQQETKATEIKYLFRISTDRQCRAGASDPSMVWNLTQKRRKEKSSSDGVQETSIPCHMTSQQYSTINMGHQVIAILKTPKLKCMLDRILQLGPKVLLGARA